MSALSKAAVGENHFGSRLTGRTWPIADVAMRMRKLDQKSLVELIGAGAVLVGLIFVGLELRQNTAAVQSSTLQGMIDLTTNYLVDTSLDPEFIRLLSKAQANPYDLDDVEALQIQRIVRSQWLRYQSAFMNWRRGSLSDADWESYYNFICARVVNVGEGSFQSVQARFWPSERMLLADDFVSYVESCRPDLVKEVN